MLNAKRELRWQKFLAWESVEKELQFRKHKEEAKRRSLARRARNMPMKELDHEEIPQEEDTVDWGKIIEEQRLDELPLHVLLSYFRKHRVTIPDTKKQMLISVKNHYYFSHGQLHKQTNRLYRPQD